MVSRRGTPGVYVYLYVCMSLCMYAAPLPVGCCCLVAVFGEGLSQLWVSCLVRACLVRHRYQQLSLLPAVVGAGCRCGCLIPLLLLGLPPTYLVCCLSFFYLFFYFTHRHGGDLPCLPGPKPPTFFLGASLRSGKRRAGALHLEFIVDDVCIHTLSPSVLLVRSF